MRRINSVGTNNKDIDEPVLRRGKLSQSPTMETGALGRTIPHAPVTSQSWGRSYTQQPAVRQHNFFYTLLLCSSKW